MIRSLLLAVLAITTTTALSTVPRQTPELYKIELGPNNTRLVTEREKWALKAEGKGFFDITESQELKDIEISRKKKSSENVVYPTAVAHTKAVKALILSLQDTVMSHNLMEFTKFHNRYYESPHGNQSSEWLLKQVKSAIVASGAKQVTVTPFRHDWDQNSIIATIPGQSNKTIIIGAHQDSVNLKNAMNGSAPGADDNGSGTVAILEAFRVLITDPKIATGQAPNTIEFHWYAAEEAGMLGSLDIFSDYLRHDRQVKAMLNQDMTGYSKGGMGSLDPMGVVTDFVHVGLTRFTKLVIKAYCGLGWTDTKCGYACSDHSSATRFGFPSAFVFESSKERSNSEIHTPRDNTTYVDLYRVWNHAKLTLGFAYELAYAPFPAQA